MSLRYAGIICEYNPFHRGHAEHIRRTRELIGGDAGIICVMSGNFVQRGECAIMEKHVRARLALSCGADLVLELPTLWAVSSAERFADAGVYILSSLGVPVTLSFASECGDIGAIERLAAGLLTERAAELTREALLSGISYAAARQRAASAMFGAEAELLKEPNNILGVEYAKSVIRRGAGEIDLITMKRTAVGHDGEASGAFAPASLIRGMLRNGEDASAYMPPETLEAFSIEKDAGRAPAEVENAERAILYRLRTMTTEEYAALPDASEGLYNRLAAAGGTATGYAELLEDVKTKRYAMSRIRRMVLSALLGITAEQQGQNPPYLRVLGFNTRGQEILREVKKTASLPVITKPAAVRKIGGSAERVFNLEARATDIYSLMCPEPMPGGTEWTKSPVMLGL